METILSFATAHPLLSIKAIGWWLLFTFVFWFLFANLMWLKRGVDASRWTGWRLWLAYGFGYPLFAGGLVYDVLYNYTWASVMFWSFPRHGEWTMTARLKRLVHTPDWRGVEARFICRYLVEPNDTKHCGDY